MTPRRTAIPRACRIALLGPALALPLLCAAHDEPAAAVPSSALHACAVIPTAAERLACYDRLAGRSAAGAEAPVPKPAPAAALAAAPVPSAAPAPAVAAPVAPVPRAPAPSVAAAAATSAAAPAAATAASAPAATKDSFGLYAAEHPAPPPPPADLTARVTALGKTESGRMTVALESGALWELSESDALLAVGDTVSIRRAAFGSFLMETPTKRIHRARRLR